MSLGSNTPWRGFSCAGIITSAAGELRKILADARLSPLYKTAPLYITDQAPFTNAALCGFFSGSPDKLLALTREIENRYGRDRSKERRWGERTLDIDILLFGDRVITETDLTIPHPRLKERAFALRPLLDLLPHAEEPGTGRKYSDILADIDGQDVELDSTGYPD